MRPRSVSFLSPVGRVTCNLEVFPKVTADESWNFNVRFFLPGLRHLGVRTIERVTRLVVGAELRIFVELNNPATRLPAAAHG